MDLVYPIHSEPDWVASALLEDFLSAVFIHTVRDPRTLFPSYFRHIVHNHIGLALDPLQSALQVIMDRTYTHLGGYELFDEIACQQRLLSENQARSVRLEDLHSSPQRTMRHLAEWLLIRWHDCLLESTFDGRVWWNRPERPTATGFDPQRTHGKGSRRLPGSTDCDFTGCPPISSSLGNIRLTTEHSNEPGVQRQAG